MFEKRYRSVIHIFDRFVDDFALFTCGVSFEALVKELLV